jgi:hypothetical protein
MLVKSVAALVLILVMNYAVPAVQTIALFAALVLQAELCA